MPHCLMNALTHCRLRIGNTFRSQSLCLQRMRRERMMPKRNKTRMKNKIRNDGLGISHAGAMVLLYPCRAYLGQEDNTVKDNLYLRMY